MPEASEPCPALSTSATSPSWLDPHCKDPRRRGPLGYVRTVGRIAVLASGSGTILRSMLDRDLPIAVVLADRPCGALAIAEEGRRRHRAGRAHHLRCRLRPRRLHPRDPRRARAPPGRPDRDGRLRHHPLEAHPRRLSRPDRQHAPGAAPGVQGLARGRRRARVRREGHRAAPSTWPGSRSTKARSSPRKRCRCCPTTRSRRSTNASRKSNGGSTRKCCESWSNDAHEDHESAALGVRQDRHRRVRPRAPASAASSSSRRAARPRPSPTPASPSPRSTTSPASRPSSTTGS